MIPGLHSKLKPLPLLLHQLKQASNNVLNMLCLYVQLDTPPLGGVGAPQLLVAILVAGPVLILQ